MNAFARNNDSGSAPLELVAWVVLLLLPLSPAIELQRSLANQLAAESIARHALRAAVLLEPAGEAMTQHFERNIERVALEIARTYQIDSQAIRLSVDCSRCEVDQVARLEVSVAGQRALGVMGLEPYDAR